MMKKAIIAALATVLATVSVSAGNISYRAMVERKGIAKVREYYCNELTADILEKRGDDIVIEKIIGVCENRKGDGRILNSADPDYDYISYRSVKGVKPGDVVLTVCIYQPGNGYIDDVVDRFDYVIDEAG